MIEDEGMVMENPAAQVVSVIGAGTMGAGIAQVAATSGHEVVLLDSHATALERARIGIGKSLAREVEKGRLAQADADAVVQRINFVDASLFDATSAFIASTLVIEAIVEDLSVKRELFKRIEGFVSKDCILASNTSSLSIASIAAPCSHPGRVLGIHFFNPAPLMPLVEVVPGIASENQFVESARSLIHRWQKVTVLAKDTPGFIVNRIARPFYGESLRIYEEGIASVATIDWAMTELGGFKMGPFQLMDLIGNDINYKVTEGIFEAFYYDPRYRPSIVQRRMVEAGLLGKKSGRGYYDYRENAERPEPIRDHVIGRKIVERVLCMLMNEAIDAVFLKVATPAEIDLAMTKGVNYPRGLLRWADEIGLESVLHELEQLHQEYGEDRYRPSPLLRRMVKQGVSFFEGHVH